jgi:hypothetical protein
MTPPTLLSPLPQVWKARAVRKAALFLTSQTMVKAFQVKEGRRRTPAWLQ